MTAVYLVESISLVREVVVKVIVKVVHGGKVKVERVNVVIVIVRNFFIQWKRARLTVETQIIYF